MWRLNSMILNNQRVNTEIKEKINKINKNGNAAFQNLWDAQKAVIRGKFMAIQSYLKKKSKISI